MAVGAADGVGSLVVFQRLAHVSRPVAMNLTFHRLGHRYKLLAARETPFRTLVPFCLLFLGFPVPSSKISFRHCVLMFVLVQVSRIGQTDMTK